jgi:hypothetical protein
MVSADSRMGLYVTVPLYFFCIFRDCNVVRLSDDEGVNDQLSTRYLGGRSFGPLLTAGTMFASQYKIHRRTERDGKHYHGCLPLLGLSWCT